MLTRCTSGVLFTMKYVDTFKLVLNIDLSLRLLILHLKLIGKNQYDAMNLKLGAISEVGLQNPE